MEEQEKKWQDFAKRMTALENKLKDFEKDVLTFSKMQESFNITITTVLEKLSNKTTINQ